MTGTLRLQLLAMLELDDLLDDWCIPPSQPEGDDMTGYAAKIQDTTDRLVAEARVALTTYGDESRGKGGSRRVAVQILATGAAREVAARLAIPAQGDLSGAGELTAAHMLLAELAARLAETQSAS